MVLESGAVAGGMRSYLQAERKRTAERDTNTIVPEETTLKYRLRVPVLFNVRDLEA